MNDFATKATSDKILECLEEYKLSGNEDLILTPNEEKKHILIQDPKSGIIIKLKMYKEQAKEDEEEDEQ